MSGTLEVVKVTHNKISVEWKTRLYLRPEIQTTSSFPFALLSDSYPVSFFLSIDYKLESMTIYIRCSNSVRAITKLTAASNKGIREKKGFISNKQFGSFGKFPIGTGQSYVQLKLCCDITWFGYQMDEDVKFYDLSGAKVNSVLSIERFHNENPDFHIIIDDQKLSTYKAVLASQSAVLAAMFKTPMKESKEDEMTINDIEYSTMGVILRIMYTGKTNELNEIDTLLKVLQASEKYQMLEIKNVCERKLQVRIRDDNVLRLLDEADTYNAPELCSSCVEYIMARNEAILSYEKFDELVEEKPAIKSVAYKIMASSMRETPFMDMSET